MAGLVFVFPVIMLPFVKASDGEVTDPSISGGGIAALVLLIAFSMILIGSCVYQSRRVKRQQEPQHRILRCGGCRRAFRVPETVEGAEFMCSRCVTEGRRRMSEVLEEERLARFQRMRESANKTVKLERITSTFFKLSRRSQSSVGNSANASKFAGNSAEGSFVDETKLSPSAESAECKICFDDDSCIVLLPCCHSGLCEGCAKDLVTLTKECYICRQEIELLAKVRKPTKQTGSQVFDDKHLSACLVAPDTLHHLTSRRNTTDEMSVPELSRRCTLEESSAEAPVLEIASSRRSTLHNIDPITRPDTIVEEPTMPNLRSVSDTV